MLIDPEETEQVRLPVATWEWRTVVGIEIHGQRLSCPGTASGLLDPERNRHDVVLLATSKRVHVKGAPVMVLDGETGRVISARHRVTRCNHLAPGGDCKIMSFSISGGTDTWNQCDRHCRGLARSQKWTRPEDYSFRGTRFLRVRLIV